MTILSHFTGYPLMKCNGSTNWPTGEAKFGQNIYLILEQYGIENEQNWLINQKAMDYKSFGEAFKV